MYSKLYLMNYLLLANKFYFSYNKFLFTISLIEIEINFNLKRFINFVHLQFIFISYINVINLL